MDGGLSDLGLVTAVKSRRRAGGVQGAHVRAQGCASSRRPRLCGSDEEDRAIPGGPRGGGAEGERVQPRKQRFLGFLRRDESRGPRSAPC